MDSIPVDKLNAADAAKELAHLADEIARYDRAYYIDDDPLMDDDAYDRLRRRNQDIEKRFPDLVRPDSPSLRVGSPVDTAFAKVNHAAPMLSIDNAFTEEEIKNFYYKTARFLKCSMDDLACWVEPKIDGLSVSLSYQQGRLKIAATRGDGRRGEDITANFRHVRGASDRIDYSGTIDIRGEVYMKRSDFEKLNQQRESENQSLFANPRNAAAGSLRQLNPDISAGRPLTFCAYAISGDVPTDIKSQRDIVDRLRQWGFNTDANVRYCPEIVDTIDSHTELGEGRSQLDYSIDGMVIKINDRGLQRRLGSSARAPRWALAWKFPAEQMRTHIRDIIVQVGRSGVLTPVAILKDVRVGDVIVRRATLHNEDEVQRLALRIGDEVLVKRAGDVIPKIVRRLSKSTTGTIWSMPSHCPQCGAEALRIEGEKYRRCSGSLSCPAQAKAALRHFVSRHAFDIEGLGSRTIEEFWQRGWLRGPADIFRLVDHAQPMRACEGWGEKSVVKLLVAIDERRRISLSRLIYALGIPGIGRALAEELARAVRSLETLLELLDEARDPDSEAHHTLLAIEGIGDHALNHMLGFVHHPQSLQALAELVAHLWIEEEPIVTAQSASPLSGKTMLFTGILTSMSRAEAKSAAKSLGARIVDTVSKDVDMVVIGDKPGSKAKKAVNLGLQILDDQQWQQLLAQHGS